MAEAASFLTLRSILTFVISAVAGYGFMLFAFRVSEYSPSLVFTTPSVIGFVFVIVYGEVRTTAFSRYLGNGSFSLLVWYAAVFLTPFVFGGVPGGVNSGGFFFLLFYPILGIVGLLLVFVGMVVGGIFGWLVRQAFETDNEVEQKF